MKKFFGVILFILITLAIGSYLILAKTQEPVFKGKLLHITLSEKETRDYTVVGSEEFTLWYEEKDKEKLAKHMKENNLIIKAGEYRLFQGATYAEVLEILEFE